MKRRFGFTLLELIIVIIIIGILATLGFMQYATMVEKSRGAEARAVIGGLRTLATAIRLENDPNGTNAVSTTITAAALGIGAGNVPAACTNTHYFVYDITMANCNTQEGCNFRATRCTAGGKNPQGAAAGTIMLEWRPNNAGTANPIDTWVNAAPY
jgi:type IV pilus assembly protein PilE